MKVKIANKTSDAASRDTRKAPQPSTSADDDFSVRMGYVGKSVKLLWPKNIESILSSGGSVCPAGATEQKELIMPIAECRQRKLQALRA